MQVLSHSYLHICLLLVFFGNLPSEVFSQNSHPPGHPVALVGDSYGKYDVTSITRNILDQEDWVFETKGTFLPVDEFKNYDLVIIAHSQERPYDEKEHAQIAEYLEKGGHLLLLNQAPKSLATPASLPALRNWLGMDTRRMKTPLAEEVKIADDSFLSGIISPQGSRPSWITETYGVGNLAADVEILIGGNDTALVARRESGKGWVCFLGSEAFRLRLPGSPHLDDSDSYLTLIRNIIAASDPLTRTSWQAAQTLEWKARKERFLLWNREWQNGTASGPVFVPPLPLKNEILTELQVNLAVDEYEALQLNLSDLGAGGTVTWKSALAGLPESALTIYVQDRPDPIPWPKNPEIAKESPFWLMPPKAIAPKGDEAVTITSGQTRIFWLKFDSHHLQPGDYDGSLEFFVDGKSAGMVTLNIQIHPVRVPKRKFITAQPLGHVYGDVNDAAPAVRFERNLRDLGFEWTLINILRPSTFLIGSDEKLTHVYIKENLSSISSNSPPGINFSSMDAYIDSAVDHNLTYFIVTGKVSSSINKLCQRAQLSKAEEKSVRQWYIGEFSRYIRDKGIRNIYATMGDELHADKLRDQFIPWSEDLAEMNLRTTSSLTTSALKDVELTQRLSKSVGAWTLSRIAISKFTDWIKEGKINLPEGTLIGTYGAGEGRGTEIRKNASKSRMIGWEAWAFRFDYCSPNPYFKGWLYYTTYPGDRGIAGERFVSFLDQNDLNAPLVNSPFVEGIRESIEDANLAAIMNWYLKKLGDSVPGDLRERAERIVGYEPESILKWKRGMYIKNKMVTIDSSREEYAKAKNEVLNILDEIRKIGKTSEIQPDLFWHHIPLITSGKSVATIISSQDVSEIQIAVQNLVEMSLPASDEKSKDVVILVAGENDPSLPDWAKNKLGNHPKNYSWIRDWKKGDQTIIWIGGTDQAQLKKAIHQFTHFLRPEGAWFIE